MHAARCTIRGGGASLGVQAGARASSSDCMLTSSDCMLMTGVAVRARASASMRRGSAKRLRSTRSASPRGTACPSTATSGASRMRSARRALSHLDSRPLLKAHPRSIPGSHASNARVAEEEGRPTDRPRSPTIAWVRAWTPQAHCSLNMLRRLLDVGLRLQRPAAIRGGDPRDLCGERRLVDLLDLEELRKGRPRRGRASLGV